MNRPRRPMAVIWETVWAASPGRTSAMTMSRPASASRRAVAAPMPRAPPVMRAARCSTGAAKRRSGMVLQDGDAQLGGQAAEKRHDPGQLLGDGAFGQDRVFGR